MTARLLLGGDAAAGLKPGIVERAQKLREADHTPRLVAVLVGNSPASVLYAEKQKTSCNEVGIKYDLEQLPGVVSQSDVIRCIRKLNEDPSVHGIIIQLPLPDRLDTPLIQRAILPDKDAEGVHPVNMGLLVHGLTNLAPCTAMAAFQLIKQVKPNLYGAEAVVVGHSQIVGKPLGLLLLHDFCTLTTCHIATQDLKAHTQKADIVISAAGKPDLIRGDMVKKGAIVIDIGINQIPVVDEDGKPVLNENGKPKKRVVGDVNFREVSQIASVLTPVPGGVGPLTVMMLLRNVVTAAEKLTANS